MFKDIQKLFIPGCNIIYGGTPDDRRSLENNILLAEPTYKTEISDRFFPKKIGPFTFKVNRTIEEILMSDPAIKAKGKSYLLERCKSIGIQYILDRRPKSTSYGQRTLASLILDVEHGKKNYLFQHEGFSELHHCISSWLSGNEDFVKNNGSFIWITGLNYEELLASIHQHTPYLSCEIFELNQGQILHHENAFTEYKENYLSNSLNCISEIFQNVKLIDSYVQLLCENNFDSEIKHEFYSCLAKVNDPSEYRTVRYRVEEYADEIYLDIPSTDFFAYCAQKYEELEELYPMNKSISTAKEFLNNFRSDAISERDVITAFPFFQRAHDYDLWENLSCKLNNLRSKSNAFEQLYKLSVKYYEKEEEDYFS